MHRAKDQCAFVHNNCQDDEIGLFSYLTLYYCKLKDAKPFAFSIISVWLAILFSTIGIAASDFLCVNLSTIASLLGMSESLAGVTFLAFGNGSPDVFSTFAAMGSGSGSLAVGELIGAAGFITAVVAGSMALVRPFKVARRSFIRDVGFFTCAATFSLGFLADGKLHAWECAIMIAFYIFYVIIVVTWHWYLGRQRRMRERNMAARAYFHIPENQELDIEAEPEDDDHPVAGEARPLIHGPSTEDFNALEQDTVPVWKTTEPDEDDETRDRYLAQLQQNMRVSRVPPGHRRPTVNPIRPSLVGALEFRSVLSSLEKSRSVHSGPIHLRRYSDETSFPTSQNADQNNRLNPRLETSASRARAVSANEPSTRPLHEDGESSQINLLVTTPTSPERPRDKDDGYPERSHILEPSRLTASPSSSGYPSRSQSPNPEGSHSPDRLAPLGQDFRDPNYLAEPRSSRGRESMISPKGRTPTSDSTHVSPRRGSPTSPFPAFADDAVSIRSLSPSLHLPEATISPGSPYDDFALDSPMEPKPLRWWPYKYLPSPHVLVATLFPTLYDWSSKNAWERFLGLAASPSIFLLTITLPVIEPKEKESTPSPEPSSPLLSPQLNGSPLLDEGADPAHPGASHITFDTRRSAVVGDTDNQNSLGPGKYSLTSGRHRQDSELPVPAQGRSGSRKEWNRWLLAIQLVTGPFFITLTGWTNLDGDLNPRNLLLPSLLSLLLSGFLLVSLFYSTKDRDNTTLPSRSRPFLAFLGFAVSIAWISTLASEVVNLLKTIGVILSISDSLLGLTVFAVGNSLGDLVADITVARLGYPVMALSACFGGPMLNILLGVGLGGIYMTLHPSSSSSSPSSFASSSSPSVSAISDPYHIAVSKTLLISGGTLLVTLIGLLILVPLNKWKMDRKIGLGLVLLWFVSTVGNVVLEIVS